MTDRKVVKDDDRKIIEREEAELGRGKVGRKTEKSQKNEKIIRYWYWLDIIAIVHGHITNHR